MGRYRVTLAYDGTDFRGWQAQGPGTGARTVQGVFEAAVSRLDGRNRVAVAGAGRTDAGVHALGQVAAFDLGRAMAPPALARALNAILPRDVRVLEADVASDEFHPRRDAVSKLYRYTLDLGPIQLPLRRRWAAHHTGGLDPGRVAAAAALYLGRRDFASLASTGGSSRTTVRTVFRSEARFEAHGLVFDAEADGFLRKMVRSMVGGLVAAGSGAMEIEALSAALEAGDRRRWPPPAEARGLTLVWVRFPAKGPAGDSVLT
jgi:tRNA pseudouridine38-40 synthase